MFFVFDSEFLSLNRFLERILRMIYRNCNRLWRRSYFAHSVCAKEGVDKELAALRNRGTWDENPPMEMEDAKSKLHHAQFARIFDLVGIKNFQCTDETEHGYRARIVFGCHDIRTASGD